MTEYIRIIMLKRKISSKELSAKIGISGSNLSNKFSRDNFSTKELIQIADALNCDLNITFIDRDTEQPII